MAESSRSYPPRPSAVWLCIANDSLSQVLTLITIALSCGLAELVACSPVYARSMRLLRTVCAVGRVECPMSIERQPELSQLRTPLVTPAYQHSLSSHHAVSNEEIPDVMSVQASKQAILRHLRS
ncbi:hypothetical protein L226DRAFT_113808 [Lentinus tigrinus ALCF2SS1-7]|uniref:uncharacterized protein n=1 Tax=Lentinus tigrinus ALCF2SS1-7 TaxID=1328758 RepID=UPI001165EE41|nr:hypothetical protein L226DRAFT_113808 [Lentinus tigrinus ALCF2SS1-7]